MKTKRNLKIASIISMFGLATGLVASCARQTTQPSDTILEVLKNEKSISQKTFKDFLAELKNSNIRNPKSVASIFGLSVKYLYNQEQLASEKEKELKDNFIRWSNKNLSKDKIEEKIKKANNQALKTEKEITDKVSAQFHDRLENFKMSVGVNQDKMVGSWLSKNYNGATSEEEAIDYLVKQEMQAKAYGRFTVAINKTSFTKTHLQLALESDNKKLLEQLEKGDENDMIHLKLIEGYKWISDLKKKGFVASAVAKKNIDQLNADENINVVSTNSFVATKKSPEKIIGNINSAKNAKDGTGYLGNFDPTFISHMLLQVVPNENNKNTAWKLNIKLLKNLLSQTGGEGILTTISHFKGVEQKTDKTWGLVDKDDSIMKIISSDKNGNSDATKLIGGSLGVKDYLSFVQDNTPGFSAPLLNRKSNANKLPVMNKNPLDGLTEKIIIAISNMEGNTPITKNQLKQMKSEEWNDTVEKLLSNQSNEKILNVAGIQFAKAFGDLKTNNRSIAYKDGDVFIVTSKFGIHILNIKEITGVDSKETILGMLRSDIQRQENGKAPLFNIVNDINNYANQKDMVVADLLKDDKFKDFIKDEKNFQADAKGNDYPKYNDSDIAIISKSLNKFIDNAKQTKALNVVKNIKIFIEKLWANKLMDLGNREEATKKLEEIYKTSQEIISEGVVK